MCFFKEKYFLLTVNVFVTKYIVYSKNSLPVNIESKQILANITNTYKEFSKTTTNSNDGSNDGSNNVSIEK